MFSVKRLIMKVIISLVIVLAYFITLSKFSPDYSSIWLEVFIWPYIKVWGEIAFGNRYIGLLFFLLYWFIVFAMLIGIGYLKRKMEKGKRGQATFFQKSSLSPFNRNNAL